MGNNNGTKSARIGKGGAILGLALLLGTPGIASGFSLGGIQVDSTLGEPFRGKIPLSIRKGEAMEDVGVSIGSATDYELLQLHRANAVMRIDPRISQENGQWRITFEGETAIREPLFNLLLKTSSGKGARFRNYSISLEIPQAPSLPPPQPKASQSLTSSSKAVSQPATSITVASVPPVSEVELVYPHNYGPVRPGETLLGIANKLAKGTDFTPSQVSVAVWKKNQKKFIHGNMNALPAGVELAVPTPEEMGALSNNEAWQIRKSERQAWLDRAGPGPQPRKESKKVVAKPVSKPKAPAAQESGFEMRMTVVGEGSEGAATNKAATEKADTEILAATPKISAPPAAETPAATQAVSSEAPIATAENAPAPATVISSELTAKLMESEANTRILSGQLSTLSDKLEKSESERKRLESDLAAIKKQLQELEKRAKQGGGDSILELYRDELTYGGAGLVVLFLAGLMSRFSRRKKEDQWETDPAEGDDGLGTAAGVAAGVAATAVAPEPARSEEPSGETLSHDQGDGADGTDPLAPMDASDSGIDLLAPMTELEPGEETLTYTEAPPEWAQAMDSGPDEDEGGDEIDQPMTDLGGEETPPGHSPTDLGGEEGGSIFDLDAEATLPPGEVPELDDGMEIDGGADLDTGLDLDGGPELDGGAELSAGLDLDGGPELDGGAELSAGLDLDGSPELDGDAGLEIGIDLDAGADIGSENAGLGAQEIGVEEIDMDSADAMDETLPLGAVIQDLGGETETDDLDADSAGDTDMETISFDLPEADVAGEKGVMELDAGSDDGGLDLETISFGGAELDEASSNKSILELDADDADALDLDKGSAGGAQASSELDEDDISLELVLDIDEHKKD
ncbi:MAG: hypothetical protein HQL52_14315 [Magnetococcales bacterium]|nr:hypothetical protein [Magnetococcales bacterium]